MREELKLYIIIPCYNEEAVLSIASLVNIQLLSLGIIGEYIGKIYMEVKKRPRYIISERTYDKEKW